ITRTFSVDLRRSDSLHAVTRPSQGLLSLTRRQGSHMVLCTAEAATRGFSPTPQSSFVRLKEKIHEEFSAPFHFSVCDSVVCRASCGSKPYTGRSHLVGQVSIHLET